MVDFSTNILLKVTKLSPLSPTTTVRTLWHEPHSYCLQLIKYFSLMGELFGLLEVMLINQIWHEGVDVSHIIKFCSFQLHES